MLEGSTVSTRTVLRSTFFVLRSEACLLIVGDFLTAHPSWWNGLVALIWLRVQVARIQREETLLRSDGHYQRYARQVRWRLVPGVW